jgi:DNA-directed RNA polymerase subunit RPC12/RpoP
MEIIQPKCLRCKEPMEEGYVLDQGHWNARHVAEWIKGAPKRSLWKGLELGVRKQILAYRCPKCGLLEQYARF